MTACTLHKSHSKLKFFTLDKERNDDTIYKKSNEESVRKSFVRSYLVRYKSPITNLIPKQFTIF